MSTYFENQLRAYNVVIATLQAFSNDICRNCIGLEGSKVKVVKGLKKLKMDLEGHNIPDVEKREMATAIELLSDRANKIDVAEECTCQKTAGNCEIGQACFTLDGALALLKQVTEPKLITASKSIDVRQACCYDTLTTPIRDAIEGMKPDEVLEVIIAPDFKDMFKTFIEREKYPLLEEIEREDEISFKIRISA